MIHSEIVCKKCNNKIQNVEKSYNLSIDYKETISEEW